LAESQLHKTVHSFITQALRRWDVLL